MPIYLFYIAMAIIIQAKFEVESSIYSYELRPMQIIYSPLNLYGKISRVNHIHP